MTDSAALVRLGLVFDARALAPVTEYASEFYGGRVIDVRLNDGLSFEVLRDRGLDVGALWWKGRPIAWVSPTTGGQVSTDGRQSGWADRWRGGMITTCGPDNIGPAREGYGQHGSYHSIPAEAVSWNRTVAEQQITVEVTGVVRAVELFGPRITVERTITASTECATIAITDTVRNDGIVDAGVPLLYHLNFGAPFLAEDTAISYSDVSESVPRDSDAASVDARQMPPVSSELAEAVFEHLGPVGAATRQATVETPSCGMRATVTWNATTLPRQFQWMWPARGGWVLGIEPSTAALFGPDRAGPFAGAPVLQPGQEFTTEVSIGFEEL